MSQLNDNSQSYQLLKQSTCPNFPLLLTAATIIIGIGTSGSKIVLYLFRLLEASEGGVPEGVVFIVADVDRDERHDNLAEMSQIAFISMGKAGAGTNTQNGSRIGDENYETIKSTIEKSMVTLMENESLETQFNLPPGKSQSVFIVGGDSGGAAGGVKDKFITATHDSKRSVGLENLEVNVWRVGSQIPIHDVTRSVSSDAKERIPANAADNLEACYIQMSTRRYLTERPPIGEPFEVQMSTRTFANVEFDNLSRSHRIQTNEELLHVIAGCLQSRIFTAAGKENESRHIDDMILGTTGQTYRDTGSPVKES
jgi:hypothetical protein